MPRPEAFDAFSPEGLLMQPLNCRALRLPFRIGATSYVIADDLFPNAQFLADYVQDMQLVLFDLPDGPSNLPNAESVAALASLGAASDLTYTVHLIEDLAPTLPFSQQHPSLDKAQRVIESTKALSPWAYILHLEGRAVRAPETPSAALIQWQAHIQNALHQVTRWAGDASLVAVENLEGYPPAFVVPPVAATAVSRCVDIGHLWLDGHEPLPWVEEALPRTRVIHLHGLQGGRDHQSVAHMTPRQLDPIMALLLRSGYQGVLTLEVFGEEDFWSSLGAVQESIVRCRRGEQAPPLSM
jgi:sugar phosphate isomerase/epimerase